MDGGVLPVDVVAVVRSHQGDAGLAREANQVAVDGGDLRHAVLLELEIEAVEDFLIPAGRLRRLLIATVHQQAVHFAGVAAGEGDDPIAVLLEELLVHARLVVVALQVRLGHQGQQVAIALQVAREEGDVKGPLVGGLAGEA